MRVASPSDPQPVQLDLGAVADAVGRLNDAGLVSAGGVTVMSLASVRRALSDRWAAKRQQVYDHVERTLVRELGPATLVVRAGEEDFLVAQPGVERLAALGRALQALRDILTFFLGEVRPGDMNLRQVDAIQGSSVICRDLPLTFAAGELDVEPVEPSRPAQTQPAADPLKAAKVFAALDGAALRVICAHDHLINLKNNSLAGIRLRPAVSDISGATPQPVRLGALDWRDAERVDEAVLERARDVTRTVQAPLFVVPAAFSTLSSLRGRRLVSESLAELTDSGRRRIALEIRDLHGVPPSRLAEVISQVKPWCHGVVAEVGIDRTDIAALAGCGFNAVSIRPRSDWTRNPENERRFRSLGELARNISPIVITRAFAPDGFEILRRAAFTHATIGAEAMAAEAVRREAGAAAA